MQYWWVNQNQTGKHELGGGYIWAPIPTRKVVHHDNVRLVEEGDIVFSHMHGKIVAVGVAQSFPYESDRPTEFSQHLTWRKEGRRVDVAFEELSEKVAVKELYDILKPTFVGNKNHPMNELQRQANMGYLYGISKETSDILLSGIDHDLYESEPLNEGTFI